MAILVPTTILAFQHHKTFSDRLKNFPVTIEYLSRMRSAADQRKIVNGLKDGTINIIIGTHRISSNDIVFKDLGLLVIDEEQKFGVRTKEKLRAMKVNVDTLTMTATPNPGWLFAAWSENGSVVSTNASYTFTVTGNRNLEAIFDIDVATNGILSDVQINVSPNPTSDLINIVIEHPTIDFDRIQVYNIHGQLMKETNMNRNNSILMDLGSLSEGVYFIQVFATDNQHFVIKKVVKTN